MKKTILIASAMALAAGMGNAQTATTPDMSTGGTVVLPGGSGGETGSGTPQAAAPKERGGWGANSTGERTGGWGSRSKGERSGGGTTGGSTGTGTSG